MTISKKQVEIGQAKFLSDWYENLKAEGHCSGDDEKQPYTFELFSTCPMVRCALKAVADVQTQVWNDAANYVEDYNISDDLVYFMRSLVKKMRKRT